MRDVMSIKNKRLLYLIKIVVTIVILWLIFRKIDFGEVWVTALQIDFYLYILLILITIAKLFTQYKNWEKCLKINVGYIPAKGEIVKSHFIGLALRFLVPGGHASFGKVFFVNHSKKATAFSIGIERFMLTWSALLFGSWAGFVYYRNYHITLRLLVVLAVFMLPMLIYLASRFLNKKEWKEYFARYIKIVPFITIVQAFHVLLTVLQYYLIVRFFADVNFTDILVGVPLILLANIIPITYAGLGLRETFSIHILSFFSVPAEIAVTASLLIFLLNSVIPAFIGAFFILAAKQRTKESINKT
jgi:glycosyltransferase 2 family protein